MIIDKMKILDHLTIQEKYLVDYIINNQEDILKKNINELAKLSYTSSATISRLCKKLGFNGYKEFKYQYAAEYSHLLELKNDFKIEPFSSESSIDDALNKIELLHKRAIEYTKSLLDRQVIERIYQLIKNAKYIEIYGTGINFSLAEIYTDIFMLDKRDFPIYHQTFDLDNVGASVDYNNFGNVSSCIIYDGKICSNNEIKDIKNDILKRIPVYTDNLDAISSYIVNEQRKAKIRKKEY